MNKNEIGPPPEQIKLDAAAKALADMGEASCKLQEELKEQRREKLHYKGALYDAGYALFRGEHERAEEIIDATGVSGTATLQGAQPDRETFFARVETMTSELIALCNSNGHTAMVVIAERTEEPTEHSVFAECQAADDCKGVELLCRSAARLIERLEELVLQKTGKNLGITTPQTNGEDGA